jgi:hypothetical protein
MIRLARGAKHTCACPTVRWSLERTHPREDTAHDNAFLRRLHALLLEHRALRRPHQSARTTVLLEADTLDVRRVYCTDCRVWCDLQADAEEAERTLGPWPGGAEWRRSAPPREA